MRFAQPYRPWRTALGLFLPLSLGIAFMIAGIGTTMGLPVTGWADRLMCSGTVVDGSDYYTTPAGGSGVHRHILCQTGQGKDTASEDVTFDGIAIAFPVYAAIIFGGCLLFAAPRMRRKAEARNSFTGFTGTSGGASPDVQNIMGLVAEAMQQGNANVTVRNVTLGQADDGDAAARLAQIQRLHDSGLLSDAEFATKRAEILSGL